MKLPNPSIGILAFALFHLSLPATAEDLAPAIRDVDVAEAAKVIAETEGIIILDIRTPDEYAAGHLAGAVNLDFLGDEFAAKLGEFDRDKPYLVHCASGNRSGRSLADFRELGFKNIYHLKPGMKGWGAAGKPVEK